MTTPQHVQPTEFPAQNRRDEPVHKMAITPTVNPDRYAAEMADIDIRESAGEFRRPGTIRHYYDMPFRWPALIAEARANGINAVIINEGDTEPEGAELIFIKKKP